MLCATFEQERSSAPACPASIHQRGLNQVLSEPCKMVAHHTAPQPKLYGESRDEKVKALRGEALDSSQGAKPGKRVSASPLRPPTLRTRFSPPTKQRCCSIPAVPSTGGERKPSPHNEGPCPLLLSTRERGEAR